MPLLLQSSLSSVRRLIRVILIMITLLYYIKARSVLFLSSPLFRLNVPSPAHVFHTNTRARGWRGVGWNLNYFVEVVPVQVRIEQMR